MKALPSKIFLISFCTVGMYVQADVTMCMYRDQRKTFIFLYFLETESLIVPETKLLGSKSQRSFCLLSHRAELQAQAAKSSFLKDVCSRDLNSGP